MNHTVSEVNVRTAHARNTDRMKQKHNKEADFEVRLFLVHPQMSGLYSEILDRLDKAKKNIIMEE